MEENYQYVDDLPSATVVPETKLPEFKIENITNQFKSTLPQYTRVKETVPLTESETLDQIADRLNNTPTGVNYVPNILAPIEVDVDTSRYEGVDINLGKLQSGKLEQYAAQTQSYWDRLWNDTKVTGANLGIGFATAFTSIYDMINDGSFIPSEDSATSKLGTISSEFAEKNSNFKTQYDIDNPIKSLLLPSFLTGSSSGWGEIAKSASIGIGTGAGIFVQELGVTALTGGTGTIPTLAANVRNLIRNSKVIEQAAQTASGLKAGSTSIKAGIASVEAANAAVEAGNVTSNIINFGKNTVRGALSAYGESAFEAQETRDSFTLEKIKEFKDRNGYLPTGADLEKIKNVAEQAHDARFLLNFGLLTVSNMPFLNSVFKQFDDVMSVSEQAAAKGLKYTGRAGDGFEKSFQLKSDWWTKNAVTKAMKNSIETGVPYLKNIATGKSITWTEGLEEGYQYWVDKATNNYYNTLYNKGTNDLIDGTVTDTIFGLANSFYQTKDQLITPEGLQNIIGGIMGGTGQSIVSKGIDVAKNGFENKWKEGSKFRTETTEQIQNGLQDILEVQKAVDIDSITGTLKEKLDSLRGAYAGVGLMQETNNVITFNKLKDIAKWHTIAPLVMRGQTDIIKDQLTSTLQDLGDDQFKQMTGVENVTPATKNEYISKVINDIDKVDKSVRKNLNTFRNRYKKGSEEYNLYEDAKKIFAFHGYLSEGMIENKKQLENQNSVLFNSPNIASALDLVINGKRRTDLVNTIDAQLFSINSTLDTLEPIVKEGEIAEISEQNKQLKTQLENQKKNYERLKENVNNFQGENREKVTEFLVDVIDTFNQTELVFNDPNLNIENQVKDLLEKYNDYTILSENLADHLETYNNLIKYYSNPTDLKETLIKYREQANLTQLSFKDLDAAKAYDYFTKKINEVKLPLDSEYIQIINAEFRKLQNEKASFEDYKEVVDKNIEQFLKEKPIPEEKTSEEEPNPEDVPVESARDIDLNKLNDYLKTLNTEGVSVTQEQKNNLIEEINTILEENPADEEIQNIANQVLKLLEEKVEKPVTVSDVVNIPEKEIKKTPKSIEEQITDLRAKEQEELKKAIPNIDDYKIEGKVDEKLLQGEDLIKYNKIYEKYDKLITPLLKKQNQETTTEEKLDVENLERRGSISSKVLESIIFTDKNNQINYLEKDVKIFNNHVNAISNYLEMDLNKNIDLENLNFKKVDNLLPLKDTNKNDINNLRDDVVLARKMSDNGIEITDKNGNYLMLVQSPENLFIDVPYILSYSNELFNNTKNKNQIINSLKGLTYVPLLEAVDTFLTPELYQILNSVIVTVIDKKGNSKDQPLLILRENYNDFVNILKTQKKNYDLLYNKDDSGLKKEFSKLYDMISYANGMNFKYNITKEKVEGSLSQKKEKEKEVENKVLFTNNLPFNYVGEWKQPVFTIENDRALALNGEELAKKGKRDSLREKINEALKELKEKTPKFYDILINNGSYFTAFSDQNGKIWIKPISLSLYNSNEKIEEIVFEDGKLNEDKIKEVSDKYIITAYDNKKEGNSVKIKLFENKGSLTLEFSKKIGNEKVAYYLNNVKQEELKNILNGTSTLKPEINQKSKKTLEEKGYKLSDILEYYNVSIIEHSAKANRLELLTNGKYYVTGVSNPVSIFQNVGFRLKFKEKKEDVSIEATISPSIVTAEILKATEKGSVDDLRGKGRKEDLEIQSTSELEAKKADIEKRRQEESESYTKAIINIDLQNKTAYTDNGEMSLTGKKLNQGMHTVPIETSDKMSKDFRGEAIEVIYDTVSPQIMKDGIMIKAAEVKVGLFDSLEDANKFIKELNDRKQKSKEKYINKIKEINNKYDAELKALEEPKQKQEELKAPVEEYIESLPVEVEEAIQETPIEKKDNLQEISDYVWNNFKMGKAGKEYTVYELKDNLDISELNRRFVELKNADKRNIVSLENKFKKDFTNKLTVKEFVRRGELPSQRAFLEDNTEIVNQYVKNCK